MPKNTQFQQIYDVCDVVEYLGLSRQGVYKLINEGRLKSFRVGKRRHKISQRALEEFITNAEARAENSE